MRETQVKTMKYTPIKMAKIKTTVLNPSDNAEQLIHYCWESIKHKNVETVTKLSCLDFL